MMAQTSWLASVVPGVDEFVDTYGPKIELTKYTNENNNISVTVNVFEGDVYFPNAYINVQKYNYQKINLLAGLFGSN